MLKSASMLCAAMIAAGALVTTATQADAGGCHGCGPIKPTYVYRTVNKVSNKTVYRDVTRTRYVQRIKKIVHVTRVQPIVRIHQVTRVHHRTVGVVRPVHVSMTQYLPARTYTTSSVRNTYSCACR